MMPFVLTGALLVLLCAVFLTRPLWWRGASAAAAMQDAGMAALRQQLDQLAALHRAGALGEAQYTEARQALEKRLVSAVVEVPAPADAPRPQPAKGLLFGLAGFVAAMAVTGYSYLGTPQALNPAAVAAAASAAGDGHSITAEQIDAMLGKLSARLKDNPTDVDGWLMLGRSLAVLGRYEQAAAALKKAVDLRGDDAMLLADYADALAVANNRQLEGEPSRLIDRALAIDPNNLKALSLAGTVAFNRQDYKGALRHWEKMAQLAPDSELAQQIQGGIEEARKLAGEAPAVAAPAGTATLTTPATAPIAAAAQATPSPSPAPAAATAAPAGTAVSGTITLAPALAGKASPEDTLFVFARPAEGPRMPLAILRKQVRDLPLTFTLDDSLAMSPAARLSSAKSVVIGARISKQGNAIAQPGDMQGLSAPVAPGAKGLKIEIAEVVAR